MNKEIKEILDDLLFTTTLPNVSVKLNEEKLNQLKDYITNLQEERDFYRCTDNMNLESNIILRDKIDKARAKLQSMFDNGNEETILDDLLELNRILGEENED